MKVCKFGGTSVGSVERMKNVANLISDDHPKIVVLSATAGTTDHLEKIVSYIFNREIDEAHNEITKLEFYFVDFANKLLKDDCIKATSHRSYSGSLSLTLEFHPQLIYSCR